LAEGALQPSVVPPRLLAHHCCHHPGVGDYPHPAPPSAGLSPTSHCPGPPPPRDICVQRSPRQRRPIGEVRAAAVSFAPLQL
jgi:hypothetical protein